MIVPSFWAEASSQRRVGGKQVTLRRFGWSDSSEQAAQAHAEARLAQAFERLAAGEQLLRREPKVPYNGAEGVPIREQILRRHGDTIVTRNSYGAECLNTPDVLFADVDLNDQTPAWLGVLAVGGLFGLMLLLWPGPVGGVLIAVALVAALLLSGAVVELAHRALTTLLGGEAERARERFAAFVAARPQARVRVYRTPAGFRLLALHKRFDPTEPEVAQWFADLKVDKTYALMCKKQRCFRARLTPKPWRLGVGADLPPRPGVWPVAEPRLAALERWVQGYTAQSAAFAACHFVEELGDGPIDSHADAVREVHDQACRALSALPLA